MRFAHMSPRQMLVDVPANLAILAQDRAHRLSAQVLNGHQ